MQRRRLLRTAAHAGLAATAWPLGAGPAQAAAAAWPSQALRMVVGFAAGSSPDLTARVLAEPLAQRLGQQVVVDNRPGAAGNLAGELVAHAGDGHTLGLVINGNLTTAKLLFPRLGFDPAVDLAPVSLVGAAPLVLVVPANAPANAPPNAPGSDFAAWLAAGRRAGPAWNYASPGNGTVAHLGMELFNEQAGLAAQHVPFAGNPQVLQALLRGDVQMALVPPGLAMAQVRAGKLRALGITAAGRSSVVPELPSLAEQGVKGFELEVWNAVVMPARTPPAVVRRVGDVLAEIARLPEVRQRLYTQGWQVLGAAPEALALKVRQERALMAGIIARRGIQAE